MASHFSSELGEVYGPIKVGSARGRVAVPGSKSLTQRYFNLALLSGQELVVEQPLFSDDTRHFLKGIEAAGFLTATTDSSVALTPGRPAAEEHPIDCGAGGTMFRFLCATLAAVPGNFRLDGTPRLRERTVAPLLASLRALGAEICCLEREGFAPLQITGASLRGGRCTLDAGASSQFLSALLMAATRARMPVEIEVEALVSEPYIDLTLDALALFGADVSKTAKGYRVAPGFAATPGQVTVEADFSAVAYPAAAAALTGGRVFIENLQAGSRQGDRRFVDLLEAMGVEVVWKDGGLEVIGGRLEAIEADLADIPDQVPTLAALAPFARGTTRIKNVPHLRIKESDRLAAMASELRRVGATVEELADGLVIPGIWHNLAPPETPTVVETWDDHRIAMAMALVGLRRPALSIRHPLVVAKSFPNFWTMLESLG